MLVVTGKPQQEAAISLEDAVARAKALLESGLAPSAAAKQAAKETGFKKGELYQALLEEGETI